MKNIDILIEIPIKLLLSARLGRLIYTICIFNNPQILCYQRILNSDFSYINDVALEEFAAQNKIVLLPGFEILLINRGVPESKISIIYN